MDLKRCSPQRTPFCGKNPSWSSFLAKYGQVEAESEVKRC